VIQNSRSPRPEGGERTVTTVSGGTVAHLARAAGERLAGLGSGAPSGTPLGDGPGVDRDQGPSRGQSDGNQSGAHVESAAEVLPGPHHEHTQIPGPNFVVPVASFDVLCLYFRGCQCKPERPWQAQAGWPRKNIHIGMVVLVSAPELRKNIKFNHGARGNTPHSSLARSLTGTATTYYSWTCQRASELGGV
jgi:hypothetical protein